MRERITGPRDEPRITSVYVTPPSGPRYLYGTYPWSVRAFHEYIVDDKSKKWFSAAGRRVMAYKAVRHFRYTTDVAGGDVTWRTGPSTTAQTNATCIYLYERATTRTYGGYWNDISLGPTSPSHFHEHWEKCKPSMNTRANLAVFLYELSDIKRMFDILPKKHFSIGNWRDVITHANNQHLNYNFGWKPFIRDVKNVFNGLSSFDKRLVRFCREQGRVLDRRWKDDSDVSKTTSETFSIYRAEARTTYSVRESSAFQFTYGIPEYGRTNLRARALLDTLGLDINLANVWAILPWSFVVDWFFNVGGYLSQYSTDWLQPWVDYIQGCHSIKQVGTVAHTLTNTAYGGAATIGNLSFTHYVRSPGIPRFSLDTTPLDADKIRLLASLVGSVIL